jgi:hypothetical protein
MPAKKKSVTQAQGKTLEAQLWDAADKMRGAVPPTDYQHVCLGLVFLRYLSAAFARKHADLLETPHADAEDPEEPSGARQTAAGSPQGERGGANQYQSDNVFWVPEEARWSHLQATAKQPTIGMTVDDAMVAIERDNARLKGVLPKDYARPGLDTGRRGSALSTREAKSQSLSAAKDNHRLGELIDLIATISLTAASEGEKTHRSAGMAEVRLQKGESPPPPLHPSSFILQTFPMLAPYKRRIYDPACGSGGMGEVRNQNYEGRKRPQGPHQAICAANHPPVRRPAEIHGGSGAGKTIASLGNIGRSELLRSPSRTEQSRVHRQMRRLAAGTGGIGVLAGVASRWGNCASGQAPTASCRVRRTHRHLRNDHQESSGLSLIAFLPSSFILQTSPRLAMRGIEADIGKEHADTFRNVQQPDLRADWQIANAEVRMWN